MDGRGDKKSALQREFWPMAWSRTEVETQRPVFSQVAWERALPSPVCPSARVRPPRKVRETAPRTVPSLSRAPQTYLFSLSLLSFIAVEHTQQKISHFYHFKVCGWVAFRTFTRLRNHHLYLVPELSIAPNRSPGSPCSPRSPPPAPGTHRPALCLCAFACPGHFMSMEPHKAGPLRLDSVTWNVSRVHPCCRPAGPHSVSWLCAIPLCGWAPLSSPTRPVMDTWVVSGCGLPKTDLL